MSWIVNAVDLGTVIQISFKVKSVFPGPSNRSNSVSSLDLEGESVSELGAGPSGSNGVEALQLLEHEQGRCQFSLTSAWGAVDAKAKVAWKEVAKLNNSGKKKVEIFLLQSLLYLFVGLVWGFLSPQEILVLVCC